MEGSLDSDDDAYDPSSGGRYKDKYVCREAEARRGVLALSYPLEHGVVHDWESVEQIWRCVYEQELGVAAEEHPVLLTEPPLNPRRNRERMAELMFETFQAPALYLKVQAICALMATGSLSGVAVDSGDGVTHAVPVYEGYGVEHAVQRVNVAGRELTTFLQRLLSERGTRFTSSAEFEVARRMKEQLCYVATDFEAELQRVQSYPEEVEQAFALPDGQQVLLGSERFRCGEALFRPMLMGTEAMGMHECAHKAVTQCAVDTHRELLRNVVLSGGTSMLPGLPQRLLKELRALSSAPNSSSAASATGEGISGKGCEVRVVSPPEREHAVWMGAAMLAEQSAMAEMWVTQEDYAEKGSAVVHEKCF